MNCLAIDDEPLALDVLRNYISQFPSLSLIETFDDAIAGANFLQANSVDLLFIDINMPDTSGLELVSQLENKPMVIFTTAHKEFAHEGFELAALDYLLKPISFERFKKAVVRATERYQFIRSVSVNIPESVIVRSEYKMVKIGLDDIEFIESMKDYIKIHLLSQKHPVLTLMSLKGILEMLPQNRFSRIHRSYIVRNSYVKSIQNKKVKLISEKELPVSESYLDFISGWKKRV